MNKINKIIQDIRKLESQVENKIKYTHSKEHSKFLDIGGYLPTRDSECGPLAGRADLWVIINHLVAEMLVLKGVDATKEELDFIKRWETA